MPKRKKHLLPTRRGTCLRCRKDIYPDEIAAELAVEYLSTNPHRGSLEVKRYYPCPSNNGFHLTSAEQTDRFKRSA